MTLSSVRSVINKSRRTSDGTEYYAMKILGAMFYGTDHDIFELEILKHLRDGSRGQLGYKHVCHLLDDFVHEGPNGKHVCMVFELMGDTLLMFGGGFQDSMIPYPVMRRFAIQLIAAVDFAHYVGVIHTDIQPSNIFVKFRDRSLIESGYLNKVPIPRQDRSEKEYTPIPSAPLYRHYFKPGDNIAEFDIALGDWGVASWDHKHLTENIQPVALRAPEVLIRAPWDYNVDWWNVGAILLELYRAIRMFSGLAPPDGHYEVREHLSEMVDLFGPFPKALLEKGDQQLVKEVFDDEGKVKNVTGGQSPPLDDPVWTPGLREEDRAEFVSFLRFVMQLDPEKRPSGIDMLRHDWLHALSPPKSDEEEEAEDEKGDKDEEGEGGKKE